MRSRLVERERATWSVRRSSAATSSGACRGRPSGCRWCRWCSRSRRPAARRSTRSVKSTGSAVADDAPRSARCAGRRADRRRAPSSMTTTCLTVLSSGRYLPNSGSSDRSTKTDLVLGVVDRVDQLVGEVADVDRVHDPAGARDREVQREVPRRVPRERARPGRRSETPSVSSAAAIWRASAATSANVARSRPFAVLVTTVFVPKYRSPRSRIQFVVSAMSCISPCMCKRWCRSGRKGKTCAQGARVTWYACVVIVVARRGIRRAL